MDINDYSARLSQTNKKYNDANNELRNNYKENLENIQDRNEAKEKKQLDNYTKAKQGMEARQADYINEYSSKTKEAIEDRTRNYKKNLTGERDSFAHERSKLKEDFDRRLSELKSTYETKDSESSTYSEEKLKATKDRYDSQVSRLHDQFQEDIDEVSTRATSSIQDNQHENSKEKRGLINSYEQEKRNIVKNESVENVKKANLYSEEMRNLREVQASELSQIKDHHRSSQKDKDTLKNDELSDMQKNFRRLTDEVSSRNQRQRKFAVKENEARKVDLEKGFAQNLYQAKREMSEKVKGGDRSEIIQDKLDHTVDAYEDRIKNIYGAQDDNNFIQDEQIGRLAENFSETAKNSKFKNQILMDEKDKQFKDFRDGELSKTKNKSDAAIATYKRELTGSELRNEAQSIKDRTHNKKVLDNQRKLFGDTVNNLNEKNLEALSEVQSNFTKEKTAFIEKSRIDHHNELTQTKSDLKEVMSKKEENLNLRNENLVQENKNIVKQYESKIDQLMKKSHKEIERLNELSQRMRLQQDLMSKQAIEAKDRENNIEILTIRKQYDKRLSGSKEMSDKQLEQTVEYYEDLLARERGEFQNKYKSKLSEAKADFDKLRQQSQLEKITLNQQFEDRINELKQAHNDALEEKENDYKSNMFKA